MAEAALNLTNSQNAVVENGIVRSTVFPNAMRDVRREKGFQSLTDFFAVFDEITYSRLAKIERGQIVPRADELIAIAEKLGVQVGRILIDTQDPSFDKEAWARDHVEASLNFRGGAHDDMRLGAAMRIRRKELKLSTTGMKADYNLPAATVSRIENADRPFERWEADTQASIMRVFGKSTMAGVRRQIAKYEKDGRLQDVMFDLFSQESLDERNGKSMISLLDNLPGSKSKKLRSSIADTVFKASNDSETPDSDEVDFTSKAVFLFVNEGKTEDGVTSLEPSSEKVRRKGKVDGFAVRLDQPVLGPGLPAGSVAIFEMIEREDITDNMVIAILQDGNIRITAAHKIGRGFRLIQSKPEWSTGLAQAEGKFAHMVSSVV